MGKVERKEDSRRRTKHLFILLILTAILLITSTYAWFSVQRDVEMSGLNVEVGVSDNMQISLDGEKWTQVITIKDMSQLLGTYEPEDDGVYYQAKKGLHTNYVPEEMKPVSTIGTVKSGEIQFVYGTIEGKTLKNITKCKEEDLKFSTNDGNGTRTENNADHPYLVFDMYIRNMSTSEDTDVLQLNTGSEVKISKNGINSTGLENSVRVGFVAYNDNAKLINDNGETIRSAEGTDNDKVAIWEPNVRSHVDAIVANDSRITSNLQDFETYGVKETAEEVADITDYEGDTQNLADVRTVKAEQKEAVDVQLTPTTKVTNLKDLEGNDFTIKANRVTKIRVYIWLEGQDPDCVDIASQGKEIEARIRLTRGQDTTDEPPEEQEGYTLGEAIHPENYGKKVDGYTSTDPAAQEEVGCWRLFYQDKDYAYLISDNQVKLGDNLENLYTAVGWNEKTGEDVSDIGKGLNPMLKDAGGFTSDNSNPNIRAVGYLTEPEQWEKYKGVNAEFAIGGPSYEMYLRAFKAVGLHSSSTGGDGSTCSTDESGIGYLIDDSLSGDYRNTKHGIFSNRSTSSVFMPQDAYPFCSPWFSSKQDTLVQLGGLGYVSGISAMYDVKTILCLRPIVMIPSDVFESVYSQKLLDE